MRVLFLILLFLFCKSAFPQEKKKKDYAEIVSQEKLKQVKMMSELVSGYPKEFYDKDHQYISVELLATIDGEDIRSVGKSDTLTMHQIYILRKTPVGSRIGFEVQWYDLKDQNKTPQYFAYLFKVIR
jgi:hypothetical protein